VELHPLADANGIDASCQRRKSVTRVTTNVATRLLGLFPLCLLSALYTTWIAGRLQLGYWPRSSLDDPKNIGGLFFPVYYESTSWLAIIAFPMFILTVTALTVFGVICIYKRPDGWKLGLVEIGLALAMHLIVVVLLAWDPLRVLEWFFD
jgi:hypothetical protein